MAFRQSSFHAPQRQYTLREEPQQPVQPPQRSEPLEQSQEWVLFSPATDSATDRSRSQASVDRTRGAAGTSQISGYGSLDTVARSYGYEEEASEHSEALFDEHDEHHELDEHDAEDGELDSLDSHLQDFRAEPGTYQASFGGLQNGNGNPVLPTHDGLGSFRIDQTAMGDGVQEHLYSFERYNPRRVKRRRESLELGQKELEREPSVESELTRRIEEWRHEQSQVLLEEIRRESRRRRQSMSQDRTGVLRGHNEAATASLKTSSQAASATTIREDEDGGFWSRITRRVIEDLMGIDDGLLSILFGESLPEDDLSSTPPAMSRVLDATQLADIKHDTWEYRLLDRVARELGLLINQLSDHPGAFSTYVEMKQATLPYAGLPIIPECSPQETQDRRKSTATAVSRITPEFQPTIPAGTQAIEIPDSSVRVGSIDDIDATPRPTYPIHSEVEFTQEEWEKQLDIKMVFRYLRSRFTSRTSPFSSPSTSPPTRHAMTSAEDSAARAARVRQHHPLVSKQRPVQRKPVETNFERRVFKVVAPKSTVQSPILHRRSSSSCASANGRLAKSVRSGGRSSSSRHYWDFGGSLGDGGSLIGATTGVGGWGEV